jgi:acyl-CoA thioesterase I
VKSIQVTALGDSTMKGVQQLQGALGPVTVSANSAPGVLQASLQAKFGPTITVLNDGVGGSTLPNQLNGVAPDTETLANILSTGNSQIVIANFGINDAGPGVETPEAFNANLMTLLTTVRNMGKTLVLEEPNPVWSAPGSIVGTYVPNLDVLVSVLDTFAAANDVPLVSQYQYIQSLPNWQDMEPGGDHPNDALYAIKAQREEAVIAPIVQQLQGR